MCQPCQTDLLIIQAGRQLEFLLVKIGQLAIVAVAFPFLFLLRAQPSYRRVLLPVGSAAIAIFALGWLFERVAGLEFMPL